MCTCTRICTCQDDCTAEGNQEGNSSWGEGDTNKRLLVSSIQGKVGFLSKDCILSVSENKYVAGRSAQSVFVSAGNCWWHDVR